MENDFRERNRELCEKYPFLIPTNRFSGKRITEAENGGYWPGAPGEVPEYDYEYTELDDMPEGWRNAFGEQLCEELKQALLDDGGEEALNAYRIVQIKEKYGSLRWYDFGNTKKGYEVIGKYAKLSRETCVGCGAPATKQSTGWICPWCDVCAEEINDQFVQLITDGEEPTGVSIHDLWSEQSALNTETGDLATEYAEDGTELS